MSGKEHGSHHDSSVIIDQGGYIARETMKPVAFVILLPFLAFFTLIDYDYMKHPSAHGGH